MKNVYELWDQVSCMKNILLKFDLNKLLLYWHKL